MNIFATPGAYIWMPSWPPTFTIMERQFCDAVLKMTLSRGRLKYKKTRMMMTSIASIQPHPHIAILRHTLNMVKSFLFLNIVNLFVCSSTNYLDNWLLPNKLIIVRNYGDDDEDVWGTKDMLESPRYVHHKVAIQTNSKFQSLIWSLT
jgi:hypothetical protein